MAQTRLVTVFEGIEDRRDRKGLRYPLGGVLVVALAAVMCGASSLAALHRFGKRLTPQQCGELGFWRNRAPCHSGWHGIMASIDADALSQALGRVALADEASAGHIALDGKSLRGACAADQPALHILHAFSVRLQAVVGSVRVPPESNEITAALTLLGRLDMAGMLITGDAIFAQREICTAIVEGGGDYLFRVKANQGDLYDGVKIAFASDPALRAPDIRSAQSVDADHGRLEIRQIETSTEAVDFLGWPGLGQIARIHRGREIKGKKSEEIAYFITSLSPESHGPEDLLRIARAHWGIENSLHWRRDVTWREDQSRTRNENSVHSLALLRSKAIALFKKAGLTNMQAAIEDCAANQKCAFKAAKYGYL